MFNKVTHAPIFLKLIVCIILATALWGVYGQVTQYDFVGFDDPVYVTQNSHIKTGITWDGLKWAFGTTYFGLWNPLVWLSYMLDYQLYGMNAGGYHLTNLILHILNALLLFLLFCRMTKDIWKGAFVAAIFAIHPLHVESVAWIAERKDVLSAFFWILTLYLYVYYTEKQSLKRYLMVFLSFTGALMCKPMVVTLPVMMILLDYWPLKRFESQKDKVKLLLWQLKEKVPFFVLSAVLIMITLNIPNQRDLKHLPLSFRFANASVSLMTYLEKTFWPKNMTVAYPLPDQIVFWQVSVAIILFILISAAVTIMIKRMPFLFVGWFWYIITITPVIGIIHIANFSMADRYYYLPSIGIALGLSWGMPILFPTKEIRRKILFPAAMAFLAVMSVITWRQCGYWKNNIELWSHAVQVTKNNVLAYNNLGYALFSKGKIEESIRYYDKAIITAQGNAPAYNNRGNAYASLGQYQQAISDFSEAIRMKPYYAPAFYNRGNAYKELGQYDRAIRDFDDTIRLSPYYTNVYNRRADVYFKTGKTQIACLDAQKACELGDCRLLKHAQDKKYCR